MGKSEGVVQASFYFNCNAYTPDGNKMADTTPEGISVLDLVTGQVRTIAVGSKSPNLYYTKSTGEPENKGEMMTRRLAAKLPMTMFTIDLKTGQTKTLLEHSTDWLNHLQFSPKDPSLLFCFVRCAWQIGRQWALI